MKLFTNQFSTRGFLLRLWPICGLSLGLLLLASVSPQVAAAQLLQTRLGQRLRAAMPNKARPFVTKNFEVYASDAVLAQKVGLEAERYRKELAVAWIGEELPNWPDRCPIKVQIGPDAGGETSFAFVFDEAGRGHPIDWQMKIFGPPDRLLDAVLPHEVTHTIFATHFGRPLPRWADEGACTTVEHIAERTKNHEMLIRFLSARPSRGIPFNRMFTMKEYPRDILPLYAQGYSLAKFLIFQKERRHFLDYIAQGMEYEGQMPALEAWDLATQEYYQFEDLSELQLAWQAWVKQGSKKDEIARFSKFNLDRVANANSPMTRQLNQPQRALVERDESVQAGPVGTLARLESRQSSGSRPGRIVESAPQRGWTGRPIDTTIAPQTFASSKSSNQVGGQSEDQASWYATQMRPGRTAQAVSFQESRKATKARRVGPDVEGSERNGDRRNRVEPAIEHKDRGIVSRVRIEPTNNRVRSMIRIPEVDELKRQPLAPRPNTSKTLLR